MKATLRSFLLAVMLTLATTVTTKAAEPRVDFDTLRERAKALAAAPYVAPPDILPPWLKDLTYNGYRGITFDPERLFWQRERGLFKLSFFHPGGINRDLVRLHELRDGRPIDIPFQSDLFSFGTVQKGPLPEGLNYAGFRLHYPLAQPRDELGAFQGASYYRFLGKGTH